MEKRYILGLFLMLGSLGSLFAQVELIKECGIPYSGGQAYMMVSDGKLFFGADSTGGGLEPWISDGTPEGTHKLMEIGAGFINGLHVTGGNPAKGTLCTVYNHEFYFLGYNSAHGEQIWKTNPNTDSTYILKVINNLGSVTGTNYNDLPYFCELNGILYFAADDNTHGSELWRTDGTDTGTHMVKDIYAGYNPSSPAYLTKMGNAIYFRAWGEGTGEEIWKTDGTEAGTQLVKDIRPGPYSCFYSNSSWQQPYFQASGNYLYFVANIDSPETHYHYWRTDGTAPGTIQIDTSLSLITLQQDYYTDVNGTFYFTASDGNPNHSDLFKSDGTLSGTVNVATNNNLIADGAFFAFKDKLYFNGNENNGGVHYGLCTSDGTTGGTHLVKSFKDAGSSSASVSSFATDGNLLYGGVLEAINSNTMEWRLLQSDGSPGGTTDIPHYGFSKGFTPFNGKMYYAGYDTTISASYDKPGLYAFTAVPVVNSINEVIEAVDITIYPNPVSEVLWVQGNMEKMQQIKITDMAGRAVPVKLTTLNNAQTNMDVSGLASGCYLLTVRSNDNTAVRKFIKE